MNELKINVVENGPVIISGSKVIALCRCGQSGNKPYCDGTHKRTGFHSPGLDLTQKAA